jgi:hypothetical protein
MTTNANGQLGGSVRHNRGAYDQEGQSPPYGRYQPALPENFNSIKTLPLRGGANAQLFNSPKKRVVG